MKNKKFLINFKFGNNRNEPTKFTKIIKKRDIITKTIYRRNRSRASNI